MDNSYLDDSMSLAVRQIGRLEKPDGSCQSMIILPEYPEISINVYQSPYS